jgi:hypothetical protein
MYFSPSVLHPGQKEHLANAYRELAKILIAGANRQRDLHAEAIERFCDAQEQNVYALAESTNSPQLLRQYISRSTPASLHMWQMATRSGEIAADIQRQIADLFGRYAAALSRTGMEQPIPRIDNRGVGDDARRQMRG